MRYAGFWIRFAATMIDTVLLLLFTLPLLIAIYGWAYLDADKTGFVAGGADILITWVMPAVAVIAFWIAKQATPGKMLLSARIVDASTGNAPSVGQLIGRYFAYLARAGGCAGGTCDYDIFLISVKVNPYGVLFNRDIATGAAAPAAPADNTFATPIPGIAALATSFQADVIAQVTPARLANPDLNSITYEVKLDKNSAESQSQSPTFDHYPNQFRGRPTPRSETTWTRSRPVSA